MRKYVDEIEVGKSWRTVAVLLLFFINHQAWAQPSLEDELSKAIAGNKPSVLLRLESRNSFISNSGVQTTGIKVGANYGPNLNLGVGYHFMTRKSAERILRNMDKPDFSQLHLDYVSAFIEYRFFNKGRYSAAIPLQVGVGSAFFQQQPQDIAQVKAVVLYEAMLNGEMKLLKYFGVGAGLGYRICLLNNRAFGLQMNSPLYNVRFNVYFQEIYQRLIR
ncbi:MAG: hypothetical protein V4616_10530 [Bacteroidota bacterium]